MCNANPCLHGGTCIGKGDGDGFICLCPFGRRGGICEEEIRQLTQPSFTSWVVGYSSFLTYPTPPKVGLYMEAKLHFTTSVTNQASLIPATRRAIISSPLGGPVDVSRPIRTSSRWLRLPGDIFHQGLRPSYMGPWCWAQEDIHPPACGREDQCAQRSHRQVATIMFAQ